MQAAQALQNGLLQWHDMLNPPASQPSRLFGLRSYHPTLLYAARKASTGPSPLKNTMILSPAAHRVAPRGAEARALCRPRECEQPKPPREWCAAAVQWARHASDGTAAAQCPGTRVAKPRTSEHPIISLGLRLVIEPLIRCCRSLSDSIILIALPVRQLEAIQLQKATFPPSPAANRLFANPQVASRDILQICCCCSC